MKLISLLPLACACTLLTAAPVKSKEYVIGVEELDYYPLYFYENGVYKGYARYILDRFEQHSGHTFVYKPYPVKRLILEFLDGNIDFKFPSASYWDASKKENINIKYSDKVMGYTNGVTVLSSQLGQSKIGKLGTLRGFSVKSEYVDDIKAGKIQLVELNSLKQLFNMLKLGRVDGIYFNTAVANYYQSAVIGQPELAAFDPSHPHINGSYHLSTIKHPEIIEEFNQFVSSGLPSYEEFINDKF